MDELGRLALAFQRDPSRWSSLEAAYEPRLRKIVRRHFWFRKDRNEVTQAGRVGLWKAAQRFDPVREGFAHFASLFVVGEIRHFVRDEGPEVLPLPPEDDDETPDPQGQKQYERWRIVCATEDPSPKMRSLTPTELDVLQEFLDCATTKQVADRLGIAKKTADFHLANIYRKYGVKALHHALMEALRRGEIQLARR